MGSIHPKAMPAILTIDEERDVWVMKINPAAAVCRAAIVLLGARGKRSANFHEPLSRCVERSLSKDCWHEISVPRNTVRGLPDSRGFFDGHEF
jgi:hypothetical protein